MIDAATIKTRVDGSCQDLRVRISTLCVTTANRPIHLRRCIGTHAKSLQDHGRKCDIAVMDDSGNAALRGETREWLRQISTRFQLPVHYAGCEEKTTYIRRLAAEGIDEDLARFVLTNSLGVPSSPGSNRNALLLHTIGQPFLSCDDDSFCYAGDFRRGEQTVAIVRSSPLFERVEFAPDLRTAVKSVPRLSCDLIAFHEELLGRYLCNLPLAIWNSTGTSIYRLGTRAANDLLAGKGKVCVTLSGVLGDSGMPDLAGFMFSTGKEREKFLASRSALDDWDSKRNVVLGVSRPTVSPTGAMATTTVTGFDHRQPLPPFSPSGRGEDTLFGALLTKCIPDSYIGAVPIGLMHAPAGIRRNPPLPTRLSLSDLLILVLQNCPEIVASSSTERLRSVAKHFIECGEARSEDFDAYLSQSATRWRLYALEGCERALAANRYDPEPWSRRMERWMIELEDGLTRDQDTLPSDLAAAPGSFQENCARLQSFLRQFGKTMLHWPEFTSVAHKLNREGRGVAIRL